MNTTKKLVLIVLVLGTVFGFAFGQSVVPTIRIDPKSMTAFSTLDLFTTDVDDFLNVNEFANVQPSKIFGFLGYNTLDTSGAVPPVHKLGDGQLNLGFAKQLKAAYAAGFFGGMPIVWESKTEPLADNKKKTTIKTKDPAAGYVPVSTGTLLVGFKNIGVSGSFTFKPEAGNKRVIDESLKTDETDAKFNTNLTVRFGMNTNGPKDKTYKSYAELILDSRVNKTTRKNNDTKITTINDTGASWLQLNAGTAFDLSQKGDITQGLEAALESCWFLPRPKTGITIKDGKETAYTKEVGRVGATTGGNIIKLNPAWTIAYEPEGKFAVRARAALPVHFEFSSDIDYTETKSAGTVTKTYPATRNHSFATLFMPEAAAAVTYRPISKLRFSLGAGFSVPKFGWDNTKEQTRDGNGKVTKEETTVTWIFNDDSDPANGKFEASSGITWFVTDKVTVDGNWNIAKNLLDDSFKTQLIEGNVNFWNTVNKLLIHNVSFLVSFKL